MKKTILSILIVAMLFTLCSCGGNDTPTTTEQSKKEQSSETTTEAQVTESTTEKESSMWQIDYYVDEFNEATDEGYISNSTYFLGKFSNSATTDSNLLVEVLVDNTDVNFFLYEYGRSLVKNSSSYNDETYNIKMKTADGKVTTFTGTLACGNDRITIDQDYVPEVVKALSQKGNTTTTFYIENSERTVTNYTFAVISSDFAKQYEKLFG